MSYEPYLIIKKADLDKNAKLLQEPWYWENENDEVLSFIRKEYLESRVFKIDEIEMILSHPELSSFNKKVREKLDELDIQYAETI